METIKFRIMECAPSMYLVRSSDCRTIYKNMAQEGGICDIDGLAYEMRRISAEVEKTGCEAAFLMCGKYGE